MALVAAVALEAGCSKRSRMCRSVPVRTALVQSIDTGSTNVYSANIQPYQQVDLSFQSNGYIPASSR